MYETYAKEINIEARAMVDIASKQLIPAVIKYVTSLARSINEVKAAADVDVSCQADLLRECSSLLAEAKKALRRLQEAIDVGVAMKAGRSQAEYYRDVIVTVMQELRTPIDKLEMLVDKECWPMPSYGDLIFEV